MASTIQLLNHMATPKRKGLAGFDNEERPSKRRSTDSISQDERDVAIGNETTRRLARQSSTTLARPKASTLDNVKRSGRIYDPPDSPEREIREPPSSSRAKQKVTKTKKTRTMNRKQTVPKSPLKGNKFGSIGVVPGVFMSSHDTPAKPNRSKGTQKSKSTRTKLSRQVQEVGEEEEEIESDVRPVAIPVRTTAREKIIPARPEGNAQVSESSDEDWVQIEKPADSSTNDKPVQMAESESGNDSPDDEALDAEIQRQHVKDRKTTQEKKQKQSKPQRITSPVPDGPLHQEEGSEGEGDERTAVSPPRTQKSRGRLPQTDEEWRIRKEAQARLRIDNAEETERAQASLFEKRGKKFMDGIIDVVQQARLGSTELWSTFGAASIEITVMVERKKEMDTTRADELSKTLRDLKTLFMEDVEPTDGGLNDCFRKLQQRAHRHHLRPADKLQRGDQTVVNLFEHIIPQSARLVRQHLQYRFYEEDEQSWKELRILVKAAHDLCNIALNWDPKPSLLEAGIRGNVHNKIRPNLRQILQNVDEHLRDIEFKHKQELARQKVNKHQAVAVKQRQELRARWDDELDQRISLIGKSIPIRGLPAESISREPIDIDDIDEEDELASEEDTDSPWEAKEDIALLNGLQEHLTQDRFALVLEQYPCLQRRNANDCITRAMYFKSKLAQQGRAPEWLQNI